METLHSVSLICYVIWWRLAKRMLAVRMLTQHSVTKREKLKKPNPNPNPESKWGEFMPRRGATSVLRTWLALHSMLVPSRGHVNWTFCFFINKDGKFWKLGIILTNCNSCPRITINTAPIQFLLTLFLIHLITSLLMIQQMYRNGHTRLAITA